MSNPTALCEVDPEDAMAWTDNRALVATGSPFSPVQLGNGKECEFCTGNNGDTRKSIMHDACTTGPSIGTSTESRLTHPHRPRRPNQ